MCSWPLWRQLLRVVIRRPSVKFRKKDSLAWLGQGCWVSGRVLGSTSGYSIGACQNKKPGVGGIQDARKFWQTVRQLRKGKQGLAQAVVKCCELLTLTGEIVRHWTSRSPMLVCIFKKGDQRVFSNYRGSTLGA